MIVYCPEAVVGRCSVKKVFLKVSQNSQENTVLESFFNEIVGRRPATLLKSGSSTGAFCEIFKNAYFVEHLPTAATECQRLMLILVSCFKNLNILFSKTFLAVKLYNTTGFWRKYRSPGTLTIKSSWLDVFCKIAV